jgi:hypothetical protein
MNPIPIDQLLTDVANGRLRIPEFQRDFIWQPEETASLLGSIMARHPAGSILTWKPAPEDLLENRPVAGVEDPDQEVERLILDGQQRTTALYRSLRTETSETYFLALDELIDTDTFAPLDTINWDALVIAQDLTRK